MTLLLGTAVDNTGSDFDNGTVLIGSSYVASGTGTADTITVRTDAANTATLTLKANIYSNSAGTPGSKLGTDVSMTLTAGAHLFTSTTGLNVAITSGTTYWIIFIYTGTSAQPWTFSCLTSGATKDTASGQSTATMAASWPATVGTFVETIDASGDTAAGGVLVRNIRTPRAADFRSVR